MTSNQVVIVGGGVIRLCSAYYALKRGFAVTVIEPWAGLCPVSPDGIPYLGQVTGLQNLLAAGGHAMMGLSLGPVSGRLIADLLAGDPPFRPITAMSPGRFNLRIRQRAGLARIWKLPL